MRSPSENLFVRYIEQGRIRSLDELKKMYRQVALRTHPDALGSDRRVEEYIECRIFYEQARALFQDAERHPQPPDYRLLFYRELYRLERLDKPFAFNKYCFSRQEIELARQRASEFFANWQPDRAELYRRANREYNLIKLEKPRGPYRKHALLSNLGPVFNNILSFQLSGLQFYRRQLKQNLEAILLRLEQRQFHELLAFIRFLIADMENGAAIRED